LLRRFRIKLESKHMSADQMDEFSNQVAALERAMSGTLDVAAAFEGELSTMRSTIADTGREVRGLSSGISSGLKKSFESVVFDGERLSVALDGLGRSIAQAAYNAAVQPVFKHVGGLLGRGVEGVIGGLLPFADGAAFSQGRVMPFASGGIVSGPVQFPMRGGTGLMGEAGPEAIMPLTRGADGRLGVRSAGGGGGVSVVMNISTPDAASFERSRGQIAAQMSRALGAAQRNR
jgi:phage-related minor tail protein